MVSKHIRGLIGLGNKGIEYKKTYHNIGVLAQAFFKEKIHAEFPETQLYFFSVSSFMNTSGAPVQKFLKLHNLLPEEAVLIHDDSDLLLGEYKLTFGGGDGGHKGVQHVLEVLKTNDIWRLKIGVRSPDEQIRIKAGEFVLKTIPVKDFKIFTDVFERAWDELRAKLK